QLDVLREQLYLYRASHPDSIYRILSGSECKLLLWDLESERHPDLVIYRTPPDEAEVDWAAWIPEIVVEIVSRGSRRRDYVEKREEYLLFGVREYWIFDAERQEVTVLRRSGGRWVERKFGPSDTYRTRLLPGFKLACGPVLRAGSPVKRK